MTTDNLSPYTERNEDIKRMYLDGATLEMCGDRYSISRQRVKQILKKLGVWRPQPVAVTAPRDKHVGVLLSDEDKEAWRLECERAGVSMSSMTNDAIKEKLAALRAERAAE